MYERAEGAGRAPKRIVLVHHNALIREGLRCILETDGFQVVWQQGDGTRLMAGLEDHSPDLILLAWEAPGVVVSLVADLVASGSKAPVAVITRPETHHDLTSVLEAGASGCLSVNMEAREFLAAVRLLAQGDILVSHDMAPVVTGAHDRERPEYQLTPRERQVMKALGRGAPTRRSLRNYTSLPIPSRSTSTRS